MERHDLLCIYIAHRELEMFTLLSLSLSIGQSLLSCAVVLQILPVPSFNIINGGSHAGNSLAMQVSPPLFAYNTSFPLRKLQITKHNKTLQP